MSRRSPQFQLAEFFLPLGLATAECSSCISSLQSAWSFELVAGWEKPGCSEYIYERLEQLPASSGCKPTRTKNQPSHVAAGATDFQRMQTVTTALKTWLGDTKDRGSSSTTMRTTRVLKPFWPGKGCIVEIQQASTYVLSCRGRNWRAALNLALSSA
jgi:hypothetical protein